MEIKLGDHVIGHNTPPFIVAEAGINHNGEIEKAFKMIEIAKQTGLNAIKFQTFKADEFIADSKQTFTYKSQGKEITESMLEMFKRYEFTRDDWFKIKKKCDDEKILFLSTPQNRSDLDLILELGVPAIKVGSDDFTNLPLLKDYASTKLPLILSCGMANLSEIHETLDTVRALDDYPTILLLTTSQYPTPPKDVNLLKLQTLSNVFPKILLGFSDHTQGPLASSLAVAMGATLFEKHFTLNHNLAGPDHWFSEDPQGLSDWVNSIRTAFEMLGNAALLPTEEENNMKKLARRSIVAIRDIDEDEILDSNNIGLKRPGTGLPPKLIDQIFGFRSTKKIKKADLIQFGDFK